MQLLHTFFVGFVCVHCAVGWQLGEDPLPESLRARLESLKREGQLPQDDPTTFTDEVDYEQWQQLQMRDMIYRVMSDPELKTQADAQAAKSGMGINEYTFPLPLFNCGPSKSTTKPTSVHALRAGDIDVVAAMGDSVTAGYGVGAASLEEVGNTNRGEVWSAGADLDLEQGVVTLGNVLQKFNPDLKGYSTCISTWGSDQGWMNLAIGGAIARGMPFQAQTIIARSKRDIKIDFEDDWKMVTLLIGGNDLCRQCLSEDLNSTNYRKNIEEALDILHEGLPRTFVNLVPMFDVSPLGNITRDEYCHEMQANVCPCGILDEYVDSARGVQLDYYNELKELVDSGKYDTRDNFTVVLQPYMRDATPPIDPLTGEYEVEFLSYDCFHPARLAHQMFAYGLWNCMLEPVGSKPFDMDMYDPAPTFACPTEANPYLTTSKNS